MHPALPAASSFPLLYSPGAAPSPPSRTARYLCPGAGAGAAAAQRRPPSRASRPQPAMPPPRRSHRRLPAPPSPPLETFRAAPDREFRPAAGQLKSGVKARESAQSRGCGLQHSGRWNNSDSGGILHPRAKTGRPFPPRSPSIMPSLLCLRYSREPVKSNARVPKTGKCQRLVGFISLASTP